MNGRLPTKFTGYRRPDDSIGVRNYVAIMPSTTCANETVRRIADQVEGTVALPHEFGCEVGPQIWLPRRTLSGVGKNPNIASVLVVALGCENLDPWELAKEIKKSKKPVEVIEIQEVGGTPKAIAEGVRIAQKMAQEASKFERERADASELILATECGGSDATSGICANPCVGAVADILIMAGGTIILCEIPELIGAEHLLAKRAKSKKVVKQIYDVVNAWEERVKEEKISFRILSKGNMAGGLTTIEEKSLGAVSKGGTKTVQGVLEYAEAPRGKGLYIMDTSGDDINSVTGMLAAGAQVAVFTTGRGTPVGQAAMPVIKVTGNPATYQRMMSNIDVNAGTICEGKETIQEVSERLYREILEVASGKKTKAELLGQKDFSIMRLKVCF